ncbi:MAG TPA: 5-formyltetrahydrofolate cyclo-ligase [Candidatus Omnitrophota bacterium]|nr:5-formyltetrahydrofolate cyclo-ligase [Candidatus Omnitrophota bacterium]
MKNRSSEKQSLRHKISEMRKKIPAVLRHQKSRKIFKQLLRTAAFCKAHHIVFYYGIPPEVETRPFLKKVLRLKNVYFPKVSLRKKVLTFHKVDSLTKDLKKGAYAIMEPKARCRIRDAKRMDLIVAPGVAFDKAGRRLGRGGGYYDRVFQRAKKVYKIGLCFHEQIVKKIPVQRHDRTVDQVITD